MAFIIGTVAGDGESKNSMQPSGGWLLARAGPSETIIFAMAKMQTIPLTSYL